MLPDLAVHNRALDTQEIEQARLPARKVTRASTIHLDTKWLTGDEGAPAVGQRLNFSPFPAETHLLEGVAVEEHSDGSFTWTARIADRDHGELVLTVTKNEVLGSLDVDGRIAIIQSRNGVVHVFEPDPSAYDFPACAHESQEPRTPDSKLKAENRLGSKTSSSRTVDVLFIYNSGVSSAYDPVALANNAAAQMNSAFVAGGIDAAVRIVGYKYLDFDDSHIISENDIVSLAVDVREGRNDFLQAPDWRDNYGADVVIAVFDADEAVGTCGFGERMLGDTPHPSNTQGDAQDPHPDNAERKWSAVTGDECIFTFRNFAHEIGHVLGGIHDGQAVNPFSPPIHLKGYGYTNLSPEFRTLMGSGATCNMTSCSRLNKWSDPSESYAGAPIGDTNQNMAVALDYTVPLAAAYRSGGDPTPSAPSSLIVTRLGCFGMNNLSWSAASGTVGWYEVQKSTNGSTYSNIYRGPGTFLPLTVSQTTWARVRSCNSSGCSSWRNGNQTATYTNGCP